MHSAHPPDPSRFETYKELKDGSGFTIKGSDFVFKYDRYGGWHDEFGNYYNSNGESDEPPSDSEHYEHQEHSEGSDDHEEDEFQKQFGGPKNYYDEEQDDPNYQKIAGNVTQLHRYPAGKPLRVKFSNMAYISKRVEVFDHFEHKIKGVLNLIFLENERRQFNGNGYFVVEDVRAGESLVKLEGQKINNREVHFYVPEVEEFLQDPIENEEMYPDFHKHKNKNYVNKGAKSTVQEEKPKVEAKPEVKPAAKVADPVKPKPVQEAVKAKPEAGPNDFVTYKFLKTAFPQKSDFKEWILQSKFDHVKDIQKVQKIEGDQSFALVTMKKKIYDKLNNTFYHGTKIVFQPK